MNRRRTQARWPLVLLVAVLLVTTAACSSSTSERSGTTSTAPPPEQGGSLRVAVGGDSDGFNPMTSQWSGSSTQVARAVLDPLVVIDRENRWQPYLAEAITPNPDFTVWTFQLRPDVRFHNGEVLDADALVAFFEGITTSPLSSQGFPERPTIAKTGDLTVTLTFNQPWSQMPTVLAEQPGYVIAPEQIASGDADHPIGTGPFVFDRWVKGESVSVERNPDYWRDGLPYLDRIDFLPMTDPAARENALDAGDVDVIELGTVGQPTLDEFAADGMQVIGDVDNVGVMNLLMNTERGALSDPHVREAIVAGIDREGFRDTVLDPSFEIANQPYPEGSPWHTEVDYPDFDPDRARQLIDDYVAERGPVSIDVMLVAGGSTSAPEYLQQQLEAIGVDAELDAAELNRFIRQFVTGEFDAVYMGQFLSAADPDGLYPFLSSANADSGGLNLNFSGYRNDAVDQALTEQRRTDEEAARKDQFATVWDELAAGLPYAFLAHDRFAMVTHPDVHGLTGFTTPEGLALPAINHWAAFFTGAYRSPTG